MTENTVDSDNIKSCCTRFYENDLVGQVLGESFHPGGEQLTIHLGEKLGLNENHKVLDVACGSGTSAIALAQKFHCMVVGIDLSEKNLEKAREKASSLGLSHLLEFTKSDAEKIQFPDETFDFVICECALCTFPDMETAVSEMNRVLNPQGKVGITDIILEDELPDSLKNIVSQVLCIAGAKSHEGYRTIFAEGGFEKIEFENHSYTLEEILKKAKKLLDGWEMIKKICDCDVTEVEKLLGITEGEAHDLLKTGFLELEKGTFGYGLFIGEKRGT
jgi:ubiquinone/menaquinone biosynthesis C-methylase UbiE